MGYFNLAFVYNYWLKLLESFIEHWTNIIVVRVGVDRKIYLRFREAKTIASNDKYLCYSSLFLQPTFRRSPHFRLGKIVFLWLEAWKWLSSISWRPTPRSFSPLFSFFRLLILDWRPRHRLHKSACYWRLQRLTHGGPDFSCSSASASTSPSPTTSATLRKRRLLRKIRSLLGMRLHLVALKPWIWRFLVMLHLWLWLIDFVRILSDILSFLRTPIVVGGIMRLHGLGVGMSSGMRVRLGELIRIVG